MSLSLTLTIASVKVGVVAVDVLVLLVAALLVWWSRKMWRNEAPASHPDVPSAAWPWWWGERAWRGYVRLQGLVLALVVLPLALMLVVESTAATGPAVELVLALSLLVTLAGAVAVPLVVLFNRPKRLVAPHLRRQPGLIAEVLGERPAHVPAPRGSDERLAGEPGLFVYVVFFLALAGLLAWACTVALVPALVAAAVSGAVSASILLVVRAAGRLPDRWEDRWKPWQTTGSWRTALQVAAGSAFAGGLIYVWERSTSNGVAAAAMGVLVGSCFAAATDGLRLRLDHRRRMGTAGEQPHQT